MTYVDTELMAKEDKARTREFKLKKEQFRICAEALEKICNPSSTSLEVIKNIAFIALKESADLSWLPKALENWESKQLTVPNRTLSIIVSDEFGEKTVSASLPMKELFNMAESFNVNLLMMILNVLNNEFNNKVNENFQLIEMTQDVDSRRLQLILTDDSTKERNCWDTGFGNVLNSGVSCEEVLIRKFREMFKDLNAFLHQDFELPEMFLSKNK